MKYQYVRYWGIFVKNSEAGFVNGRIIGPGYSGNAGELNNLMMDAVIGVGPLPAGTYTISHTDEEKGPLTHHLEPDPANTMYGRAGFLIHGDNSDANHTASDGCIVSPPWVREIFQVEDIIEVI